MVSQSLILFYGDVIIFSRIKDFSALLTFNELYVVLAGNDFDDGMFTRGDHEGGEGEYSGFCPCFCAMSTLFWVFGSKKRHRRGVI